MKRSENKNVKKAAYSFEEARRRAEGYLTYIGAYQETTGKWSYDGDLECSEDNFLIYDNCLTVDFYSINGDFSINSKELIDSCDSLPNDCYDIDLYGVKMTHLNFLPICDDADLSFCDIEHIDDYVLDNAVSVNLGHNKLKKLPKSNSIFKNLFLNNNELTDLTNLPVVTDSLVLHSNNIRNLYTDNVFYCEEVDLSSNSLTYLDFDISSRVLNVCDNTNLTNMGYVNTKQIYLDKTNIDFSSINDNIDTIKMNHNNIILSNYNNVRIGVLSLNNCEFSIDINSNFYIEYLHTELDFKTHDIFEYRHLIKNIETNKFDYSTIFYNKNIDGDFDKETYYTNFLNYIIQDLEKSNAKIDYMKNIFDEYYLPEEVILKKNNYIRSLENVNSFNL